MNEIRKSSITSLEIAELTGKTHKNVLQAIRTMEPAWTKVTGLTFQLSDYIDSTGRMLPMYELSKSESLFVGTKFNDEARARLIIRWEKLENGVRVMSSSELLLESVKLTIENEKQIAEMKQRQEISEQRQESVENKMEGILQLQAQNANELMMIPTSNETITVLQVRDMVRKLVNRLSSILILPQQKIWDAMYHNLYYRYHVSIKAYKKLSVSESLLDVAVRNGHIDKLYAIISEIIREKGLITI